jgi:RNA polymerase sigma-70 factor (ECF subfamily)
MSNPPDSGAHDRLFSTTQWSVVLSAAAGDGSRSHRALARLCEAYWYPIYAHLRRLRNSPDAAQETTQGFFAHLLATDAVRVADPERGRFRAFLKVSLHNFMSHERQRAAAHKRGGGQEPLSLDFTGAEASYRHEPSHTDTPEALFERSWARTILGRALERLRSEQTSPLQRDRLRRLEPLLTSQPSDLPYARVAAELGMSEPAVKVSVHRLRRRFGQLLRAEVAETVRDETQVDDELRHLLRVVSPGSPLL